MANGIVHRFLDDTKESDRDGRLEILKPATAVVRDLPLDRMPAFTDRAFQVIFYRFDNPEELPRLAWLPR